jgi:predicted RNA-binding protein YlqC (UPF0109 family)
MPPLQNALRQLILLVAQKPEEVTITEVMPPAKAFEIKVSSSDYFEIMSRIHMIKTLAMRIAQIPEGESVIVNLVVNDNRQPLRE